MGAPAADPTRGYLAQHREGRLHSEPGREIVLRTEFPVEKFYGRERGSFSDDLSFDLFEQKPLDDGVLVAVRHLWDLQRSTTGQLRDLFAGWTSKEARIDAFLTTWAYERFWIADALKRVLAAHGAPTPAEVEPDDDLAGRLGALADQIHPMTDSVWTNLRGERVVAGQMARGLSRESTTAALLRRLREVAGHPVIDRLCDEALERTQDYIGFFREEARARLLADAAAAASARRAVRFGFSPLLLRRMSAAQARRALEVLAPGVRQRRRLCREADDEVHALPGLRGPEPLAAALRGL
ncbi:hypothetical protein [Kocuria palustris]|uniref:hypothetical protein n=1 Tax=Kocuria palustris TaxID=71999 RepID=UPI0011AB0A95|nr:hypothetical protein [Kocuria palustris]